ncbi:MAG: hypothetical protein GEU80_00655 [Dehalococcoidia bacterium]|nr:hypothetical protein [Dehalococcoidia bacterium]
MHLTHLRRAWLILFAIGGAALFLASPSTIEAGGACRGIDTTVSSDTTVRMERGCFGATVTRVEPGTEVTWVNKDPSPHAVAGAGVQWCDYEAIDQDGAVTHRFDEPGVYPYFCALHPGMIGAVVVEEPGAPVAASEGTPAASEGGPPVTAAVAVGALMLGAVGASVAPRAWRRPR